MGKRPRTVRLWAVLFWLAVWQLGAMALNQELFLVSPLRVLGRLGELIVTGPFWLAVGRSSLRIMGGFLAGAGAGVVLAALAAWLRRMEELLAPAMAAIRSVPVASFIILALVLFPSRSLAALIAFLMVLPVVYANVLEGIRSADRELLEMGRVFRLPLARRLRYLYVPQVYPFFEAACGTALGLSWKAGVAAEVIGMPQGSIGERLQQAKVYLNMPDLFAWTLTIVLVSLALERLLRRLLRAGAGALERM